MARGLNTVNLVGTLTQAPEMRYTANGLAILELNVAGNDHVVGSDGQERELAWYHRVSLFGTQAEMMADQLNAGDPVFIDARLNFRTWETPEGQRRSALNLNANRVERVTYGTRGNDATVQDARGQDRLRFALNEVARTKLINGWDDTDMTASHGKQIAAFRDARRAAHPWAWPGT
jgi:single-strand DNA-binding protein